MDKQDPYVEKLGKELYERTPIIGEIPNDIEPWYKIPYEEKEQWIKYATELYNSKLFTEGAVLKLESKISGIPAIKNSKFSVLINRVVSALVGAAIAYFSTSCSGSFSLDENGNMNGSVIIYKVDEQKK